MSKFKSVFDENTFQECSDEAWMTHKRGGLMYNPKKIDVIIKPIALTNVSVKVHEPLLTDSIRSDAHYPIIFDVYNEENGQSVPCQGLNCEFKCNHRYESAKKNEQE
ncbi:hypothetical protein PMAYCL1PPCAC_10726, partial [Pristionchus mayeri]